MIDIISIVVWLIVAVGMIVFCLAAIFETKSNAITKLLFRAAEEFIVIIPFVLIVYALIMLLSAA